MPRHPHAPQATKIKITGVSSKIIIRVDNNNTPTPLVAAVVTVVMVVLWCSVA